MKIDSFCFGPIAKFYSEDLPFGQTSDKTLDKISSSGRLLAMAKNSITYTDFDVTSSVFDKCNVLVNAMNLQFF